MTHDKCVRLRCSSVLEHRSRIRRSHIRSRVRIHEGVRRCLGLPRVNEYAAVAGWLVKTVALLAYPFLPPPPLAPLVPLWSSSYPLTRPPRDSQTPGDFQPPCPPLPPVLLRVLLRAASSLVFLTFPIFHSRQARA